MWAEWSETSHASRKSKWQKMSNRPVEADADAYRTCTVQVRVVENIGYLCVSMQNRARQTHGTGVGYCISRVATMNLQSVGEVLTQSSRRLCGGSIAIRMLKQITSYRYTGRENEPRSERINITTASSNSRRRRVARAAGPRRAGGRRPAARLRPAPIWAASWRCRGRARSRSSPSSPTSPWTAASSPRRTPAPPTRALRIARLESFRTNRRA